MASWETGMKVDPVAYTSFGNYSEVYGSAAPANRANEFVSWGMIEDAPNVSYNIAVLMDYYFKRRNE